MKEKFGDKVEIINITTKKSFLKSFLSEKSDIAESFLNKLEERISFNKFGL
jgi:hypothetical protein